MHEIDFIISLDNNLYNLYNNCLYKLCLTKLRKIAKLKLLKDINYNFKNISRYRFLHVLEKNIFKYILIY